jgi:hypothetical protein
MELGGTTTSDKIALNGGLAASGTTTVNLIAISGFGVGTYPLISGTAAISAANFAVGTAPAGYGYVLGAGGGTLSVTVVALPAAPAGLLATGGNAAVSLGWSASGGATSYNVKRSMNSGSGYTTLTNTATTSYHDTSVSNGTTYYYMVSAANAGGEGTNSAEAGARPTAPIGTQELRGPAIAISGNTTTLTVRSSVTGHTYQLQYCDNLTGPWLNCGTAQAGTSGDLQLAAPIDASVKRRFYRILIQP